MKHYIDKMSEFVASGWCQGVEAISEAGKPTSPVFGIRGEPAPNVKSLSAARWSLYGAYRAALLNASFSEKLAVRASIFKSIGRHPVEGGLQAWNDESGRSQDEVLSILKEAA